MKKVFLALILSLLLSYPVLAISTDMKPSYEKSETMIIQILGNILEPIQPSQVILKRANVEVPWTYDIKRIGNDYFLYGVVPVAENNYTLYINDISTTVDGQVQDVDFNQSFGVSGNLTPYTLTPGFAISEDEIEFDIFLNKDLPETISVDFPEPHDIVLSPGENTFKISVLGLPQGVIRINIGMYSVPIYIISEQVPLPDLRFAPRLIESTILFGEFQIYPFTIINSGDEDLDNVILQYDSDLFLVEPSSFSHLAKNEEKNFNLTLRVRDLDIDERIILVSSGSQVEFPVRIIYTEDIEEVGTPYLQGNYSESQGYYCAELQGTSCSASQTCSGESVSSLDVANCCLADCIDPETSSYAWVGYLIAAIILIVILIIGARYLKARGAK